MNVTLLSGTDIWTTLQIWNSSQFMPQNQLHKEVYKKIGYISHNTITYSWVAPCKQCLPLGGILNTLASLNWNQLRRIRIVTSFLKTCIWITELANMPVIFYAVGCDNHTGMEGVNFHRILTALDCWQRSLALWWRDEWTPIKHSAVQCTFRVLCHSLLPSYAVCCNSNLFRIDIVIS